MKVCSESVGEGEGLARPHLTARILSSRAPAARTVVSAPAGYGKSLLLQLAAREAETRHGITALPLQLGDSEGDASLFVDILCARIAQRRPESDLRSLLMAKRESAPGELGARLAGLLDEAVEGELVVLLDDLERVSRDSDLGVLLEALLSQRDGGPPIVVGTRNASSAASAHAETVLGAEELAFDREELATLLTRMLGGSPGEALVEDVAELTRGWPALAAQLAERLRTAPREEGEGRGPEWEASLEELAAEDPGLERFVRHRVLGDHPAAVCYFARVTAVFGPVAPASLPALFGRRSSVGQGGSGSRRLLDLPEDAIRDYVERLRVSRLVESREDGGAVAFPPLLGTVLRSMLAREDPELHREAHRRAADWSEASGRPVEDGPIDHLLEAGAYERAAAALEPELERVLRAGGHRLVVRWLEVLEAHYASLPLWARYGLARAYTAVGQPERAREQLDGCRTVLSQGRPDLDRTRWDPRIYLARAELCERRGLYKEGDTYCKRGLDLLAQQRRRAEEGSARWHELGGLELELRNLRARVKAAAGVYDKAREIAAETVRRARSEARRVEALEALEELGRIEVAIGAPQAAMEWLDELLGELAVVDEPVRRARALVLRAEADRIGERVDEASRRLDEAEASLGMRRRGLELAGAGLVRARVRERAGEEQRAVEASYRRALEALEGEADARARVDVLTAHGGWLARRERPDEAEPLLRQAGELLEERGRADVHRYALHLEATGHERAARGRLVEAIQRLEHALERADRLGTAPDRVRMGWTLAVLRHRRLVEEQRGDPEAVLDALAAVFETAEAEGVPLPFAERATSELERTLLAAGASYGDERVRRSCAARGGDPGEARSLPEEVASSYRAHRRRTEPSEAFVVTTREGRYGATEEQVEELLEGPGREALVLRVDRPSVVNFGVESSLNEKRVILPLLLHFLRNPDRIFSMEDLAGQVWGGRDAQKALQTKVKVAISRLRGLLGKQRDYVVTTRVERPPHGSVVAYRLAADLPYYVVERSDEADPVTGPG